MPYATKPELDATKTPTLLDIAWAAGVYEGEGTVHQRRIASAQTEVVQKDPEILYRLRDWFGGSVGMQGGGSTPEAWRCHSWTVCGDRCRLFVALIYGYLSARRRAAIDATRTLEFLRGQSPVAPRCPRFRSRHTSVFSDNLRRISSSARSPALPSRRAT